MAPTKPCIALPVLALGPRHCGRHAHHRRGRAYSRGPSHEAKLDALGHGGSLDPIHSLSIGRQAFDRQSSLCRSSSLGSSSPLGNSSPLGGCPISSPISSGGLQVERFRQRRACRNHCKLSTPLLHLGHRLLLLFHTNWIGRPMHARREASGRRCAMMWPRSRLGWPVHHRSRNYSRSRSRSRSKSRSRSSLRRWRWRWSRLVKRHHHFSQHQLASIADLPHHGVQSTLEGDIVVLICVPECIPHPRSQDQTEPSLRLEAFCQHKRYHIKLLLMRVVGLQPPAGSWHFLYLSCIRSDLSEKDQQTKQRSLRVEL